MDSWPVLLAIGRILLVYHLLFTILSLHLVSTGLIGRGDCFEKLKNLGENDFRLKCTPNGFYEQIQCDNRTGYCFCVDERTGVHQQETQLMRIEDRRHFHCDMKETDGEDKEDTLADGRAEGANEHQDDDEERYRFNLEHKGGHNFRGAFHQDMAQRQPPTTSTPSGEHSSPSQRRSGSCRIGFRVSFLVHLISLLRKERHQVLQQQQQQQQQQQHSQQTSNYFIPGIRSRPTSTTPTPSSIVVEDDGTILRIKFHELDLNKDERLVSSELAAYLQQVMGNDTANGRSKYSDCARSLFAFCDPDQSQYIGTMEFVACLNISNAKRFNRKWNANRRNQNKKKGLANTNQKVWGSKAEQQQQQQSSRYSPGPTSSRLSQLPRFTLPVPEATPPGSASSSGNGKRRRTGPDCQAVRSDAIGDSSERSTGTHFIPNCTSDGYYQPIQCHNAATCWCVSKSAGTPIKRYTENSARTQAQCERVRKGCNQQRRRAFHVRLRQVLGARKLSCVAAFAWLDVNGDGQISRSEWTDFERQWWSKWTASTPVTSVRSGESVAKAGERSARRLEKCFRTEVSFCDEDGDEKMVQDEWINCCERDSQRRAEMSDTPRQQSQHRLSPTSDTLLTSLANAVPSSTFPGSNPQGARRRGPNKSRTGPNPFLTILKPD